MPGVSYVGMDESTKGSKTEYVHVKLLWWKVQILDEKISLEFELFFQ